MGTLTNYALANRGVNVDKTQLDLDDGELTKAQNAIREPRGTGTALRKRPGLVEGNSVTAAGSLLGGIGVPLSNQTGTGSASASIVHTLYLGRQTSAGAALGWVTSTDNYATQSLITGGTPANPRGVAKCVGAQYTAQTAYIVEGQPGCIVANKLYYAADTYTLYPAASHTAPPIRVFDGVSDRELCRIPYSNDVGAGTNAKAIITVTVIENIIYVLTFDGGLTTAATSRGRVFRLDPDSGALTQLGASFPAGHIPICLTSYLGFLWVGTFNILSAGCQGRVYYYRPAHATTWTLDLTAAAGYGGVISLSVFQGELYAGMVAVAGTAGVIQKRDRAGVWSVVETGSGTSEGNGYVSLITFNNVLLSGYWDRLGGTPGKIRKFDGTTWTTPTTLTAFVFGAFYAHNGFCFAIGTGDTSANVAGNGAARTTDGTTWTNLAPTADAITPIMGAIVT